MDGEESAYFSLPHESRGFELVGDAVDLGVLRSIKSSGHYQPDLMIAIRNVLRPDAVCVDGGANIGATALAMSAYAPRGTVYAFEPSGRNFEYLRRNVVGNDVQNIVPLRLGLWDGKSSQTLHYELTHGGGAYISDTPDGNAQSETIETTSLDEWVREQGLERLDFVKIDVEGSEPWVLSGALDTIRRFRPVVALELNPLSLRLARQFDYRNLFKTLAKLFRVLSYVREDGSAVWIANHWHAHKLLQRKGYLDLVCFPNFPPEPMNIVRHVVQSTRDALTLTAVYNPLRPSPEAFLFEPAYKVRFISAPPVTGPGQEFTVELEIRNTGHLWLDSSWANHPVRAAYHVLAEDRRLVRRDGLRTPLVRPIGPGRRQVIALRAVAPTEPGRYLLRFSLVQELYGWADQIRPDLAADLPFAVR